MIFRSDTGPCPGPGAGVGAPPGRLGRARGVALWALSLALLGLASEPSSAADPNAPTDEQVAAAVAASDRLLNMGRVGEAYEGIRPIAEARPDSNQATFALGLAALAAADAAAASGAQTQGREPRELYNISIRAFRGMLVKDPSLLRVRLELARALFSRGRCLSPPANLIKHILGDDCWAAEQHFLRVLGSNVPPQVALNVRRYIQVCRARKRANGSLTLALAPDSNVNTSTSAQTVNIFGLPFQLTDEARATSGIGVVASLGAEIQRPLPKFKWIPASAVRLRVGGILFRREYSGGDWDDHNYSTYAGPRFISSKGQWSILFQADSRAVNGRPYSRQYGLRLEGVRLVTRKLWVGGSLEGSRQTATSVEGPIGKPGNSWNGQSFASYSVLPSLNVRFMGGAGHENTDRLATRHRSKWVGVMGTYDLPLGFSMTLAQQLFFTDFEQPNYLFSPNPPETKLWFSRLALFNRKIRFGGFSPSISLIREKRDSNLTLYQYERYRAEGGVVRVF
ncbi:MAG: surface lipoprotein assembly modifier [Bryobacterales bacterium]|nr:surface lipoprotein assembly modifier [Bryobacterales bacterium]